MKRSAWRLAVAAILFAGWIGYLAFLAATTTEPTVLSRSQFLSADLYVVAEVSPQRQQFRETAFATAQFGGPMAGALREGVPASADRPDETVVVRKVHWAANPADAERKTLRVKNLPKCGKSLGWEGPGEYILALSHSRDGADLFQVTPLPKTPGFGGWSPEREEDLLKSGAADGESHHYSLIYKATPTTLRQLELLTKEYHP